MSLARRLWSLPEGDWPDEVARVGRCRVAVARRCGLHPRYGSGTLTEIATALGQPQARPGPEDAKMARAMIAVLRAVPALGADRGA